MIDSRGWRRPGPWAVTVLLIALALPAVAGPWSQRPEAVDRLQVRPGERQAEQIVRSAEDSLAAQAESGRLAVVRSLFDTYATLVSTLDDGRSRLAALEDRIARILLIHGDVRRDDDLGAATRSWSLAAELDPGSPAAGRLRSVFEPPGDPEPGQVWRSPVDGAALVFHPAAAVRIGCTARDGACLEDEVYFRWVELPALWVESREVSNARYRRCVEAGFCEPPADPGSFDDPRLADHPVVGVSWRQARTFARWVGRELPSEAEWERAARGEVTDARFPWGNGRKRELANVWAEPRDSTLGGTRPGGSFPATGYGLFDVAGNVWEWCQDRYSIRFSQDIEGGGAAREGWGRVVRGGSWRRDLDMARVSARLWYDPEYAADDLGFRCVLGLPRGESVDALVQQAARAFPAPASPAVFDQADLEEEDRRYLERRAITLLVVEGRMEEALAPAASRLRHDERDPVATDLFERFEAGLLAAAGEGAAGEVAGGLEAYREVSARSPRLAGRFDDFQVRVVERLRRAVAQLEQRGETDAAFAAAELVLAVVPDDAIAAAAASRLVRRSGAARVWPIDGKGMAWVAGTSFRMGASVGDSAANADEMPPREVRVDGFWIDRTEVTNDEYRSCVSAGACTPPARPEPYDDAGRGDHPVVWVDWYQARSYAAWAGKRLPSEAEWELAARAGSELAFPWGTTWRDGAGNAVGVGDGDPWNGTAPVASFEPNRWGLYDTIGNVAEWVDDVYNGTFFRAPLTGDPWYQETGPAGERRRVVRGGAYDEPTGWQRVSRRLGRVPDRPDRAVGFRCAADEQ